MTAGIDSAFATSGCAVYRHQLAPADVDGLRELPAFQETGRPGDRLTELSEPLRDLVAAEGVLGSLARRLLSESVELVRVLTFDKTAETNWAVAWHQDRTFPVRERVEAAGYGPWAMKRGVPHVEMPAELLQRLVTLRLHLDDCTADNGALKVIPGSWRAGRLDDGEVAALAARERPLTLEAMAGDVVAMRGLIVHASDRSQRPARRRVLHADYCDGRLAEGLQWRTDA